MHIKQINIQGFKSYKDQTTFDPFSPKHNVIVGRNGSGKSNFFWAIRFVLSDAYGNMTREERQSLLHEGTGPATISAYVEVIFDNTDGRFPTGKDEVVLRRTIGLKKDEYSLDKKSVTKTDVLNLLESAGFSRSNPYYIVPQGRITALTNAKDNERLQLLKEVAGTRIYENRRQESIKIMEETDAKRAKIDELLEYIEQRLNELEGEKEELKQYHELDKERRCLEYTIYHREQSEVNENLERLEEQRRLDIDGNNQLQNQFSVREKAILEVEKELRSTEQRLLALKRERDEINEDKDDYIKALAALEMVVKDLEDQRVQTSENRGKLEGDLADLDRLIGGKEAELAALMPEYNAAAEEERGLLERKSSLQNERSNLLDKQGRGRQFRTRAERDTFLNNEISSLEENITANQGQITALETEVANCQRQLEAARTATETIGRNLEQLKERQDTNSGEIETSRLQRSRLDERRKELWREEQKFSASVETAKEEFAKAERVLMSSIDRNVSSAIQAIKRITARQNIQGVYGPLYELFEVEDRYSAAVEVIGGGSLFHIVVDTDDTAAKLLEILNRDRSGRVTFMPLNRLKAKQPTYPNANDAVPMVQKLQFDVLYTKAFMQVFGKAIICPSLEIAAQYARQDGLNAVTLDGDRADRKGSLTGGYIDAKKSKLDAIKTMKRWELRLRDDSESLQTARNELREIEQEVSRVRDRLSTSEAKKAELKNEKEQLMMERRQRAKEVQELADLISKKERSIVNINASVRTAQDQLDALRAEVRTPLQRTLNATEQARLETVTAELEDCNRQLSEATPKRAKLESRKNIITIELNSNLRRNRENVLQLLENAGASESIEGSLAANVDRQLAPRQEELRELAERVQTVTNKLQDLENEIDDLEATARDQSTSLERTRAELMDSSRNLERQQRNLERYLQKKSLLLKRKEECTRNIRDLGVLPEEALRDDAEWSNLSSKQLLNRLHRANEQLKKFGHVNKKAFEQYNNFTKQRDGLNTRKKELDESAKAIEDLIKVLDQRKDEAIERTFKQVALYFAEVWRKLVPTGRGQLVMISKAAKNAEGEEEEEEPEELESQASSSRLRTSSIDRYSGVGISVSFNSSRTQSQFEEGSLFSAESVPGGDGDSQGLKRMNQLSGGQKSLVALALIFAIQMCDPAPFYLFDEIDAALDAQYRTAVANMVHELSEKAQFITTTFRPELLMHADKFYGVTFTNKVSKIQAITKDDATQFVEQEQPQ
ncbi:chromosome segregation protein sudA [Zopfochytrium polystomum]|nr:chromosome segregation protein sudA [Zopfochytrium polystomum]